jgi:hypothetical protein
VVGDEVDPRSGELLPGYPTMPATVIVELIVQHSRAGDVGQSLETSTCGAYLGLVEPGAEAVVVLRASQAPHLA